MYKSQNSDRLPSQLPGGIKSELDDAFARGVALGRRVGMSAIADYIRDLPYSADHAELVLTIERMKNA